MNETALRVLLRQTMATEEPPIGRAIVGGAVRGARTARRRRLAVGITAVAAMVPALAFGVPAAIGALAPPGQHGNGPFAPGSSGTSPSLGISRPSASPGVSGPSASPSTPSALPGSTGPSASPGVSSTSPAAEASRWFARPGPLEVHPPVNPVTITSQSFAQLLIDEMPAGSRLSQVQGKLDLLSSSSQVRSATAQFNDVSTAAGSGSVHASLLGFTGSADMLCANSLEPTCRQYQLPGGVIVVESYQPVGWPTPGTWYLFSVAVYRPGVGEFGIDETDATMDAGSKPSKGLPLTPRQMVRIALDSRWQWTMSQSFVQNSSGLTVAPLQ